MRRLLFTSVLLGIAGLCEVSSSQWGDPSGFLDDEQIEVTELHPAVGWVSAKGTLNGRPLRTHVVTANLAHPEISLQALAGERFINLDAGQRFRRSAMTEMLSDSEALAAINVGFFDIQATQAPEGLLLRDGILLREPAPGRGVFALQGNGTVTVIEPGWRAHVRVDGRRRDVNGINSPGVGENEVAVYLPPWTRSPSTDSAFARDRRVTEILVERTGFEPATSASGHSRISGRVQEVRADGEAFSIGENEFVVTAFGSAASTFRRAGRGADVEVAWQLTGLPGAFEWHELREAVAGGNILIRDGANRADPSEERHPRSAGATDRSGERVLLVLVEGRSDESAGISLADLSEFLSHMGAHQAVNFDGGGSSALAAAIDGKARLLNAASDGRERYVPTGLGVMVGRDGGSLEETRTWTGAGGREMEGVFHHYDAGRGMVTMTLDGRRFTFPLSSLSEEDQALILEGQ